MHLLGGLNDVHRVVADALKIADELQKLSDLLAGGVAERLRAELKQVSSEHILVLVGFVLALAHLLRGLGVKLHDAVDGLFQRAGCIVCHILGDNAALLERERRSREKALVERDLGILFLAVGNEADRELFKQPGRRQQQRRAGNVERRVRDRNAVHRCALAEYCRSCNGADNAEHREPHHRADDVERQVDDSRALCVAARADGGDQRRDAGADVLAHYDGYGRGVAHLSGQRQSLKNADGCRA